MLKILFVFNILLLHSTVFIETSTAQTLASRHFQIRAAFDNKDYDAAFRELQSLQKSDPQIFTINNYDYLLARVAEERHDLTTAIIHYQKVLRQNSVLAEYALWHLSQLMQSSGNFMLERLYLQQLLVTAPESLLAESARMRLATSFFESKDYAATIQSLKFKVQVQAKAQEASKRKDQKLKTEKREELILLGNALLRVGASQEAREIFVQLINQAPNPSTPDDFALAAVRGLDVLDGGNLAEHNNETALNLLDHEHSSRAFIYQFNRDFASARRHFQAIVKNLPNSSYRPNALLQLGRIAHLEEKYNEAIAHFERVQSEYPEHVEARDALNFKAGAYSRGGNLDEAIANYKIYITKYIENSANQNLVPSNPERPYLNIIDALRDKGLDTDALEWIRLTREKFRNQIADTQALFSQLRIHLSQKDWNSSLRDLDELEKAPDLGGVRVSGGTDQAEITFLKAICYEQLNRYEDAFNQYLAIPDGRNEYYGGRATKKLREWSKNQSTADIIQARFNSLHAAAKQALSVRDFELVRQSAQNALRLTDDSNLQRELFDLARAAYSELPAYHGPTASNVQLKQFGRQKVLEKFGSTAAPSYLQKIADELLFLGLYDEAAPALDAALQAERIKKSKSASSSDEKQNFTLAVYYQRGGLAQRAMAYAEPLWQSVPADFLLELAPREMVELLYPAPFADVLLEHAKPRSLDPKFLLAIMRQESRFRAGIKSASAARGLMQFIPSTAEQVARQLDQINFSPNNLYDPSTAILFGSQYVADLFRQFPNEPQAVAASYNGGEVNMTRWLVRSRSLDADKYVAEIQYAQSKDYVYKVMANYRVYQTLYNETLQRK